MEISKIAIENFKGIDRVVLSPLKPVNILIGRNNSGKSSVLAALSLLSRYFGTLQDRTKVKPDVLNVAEEYFRVVPSGGNNSMRMVVTVTSTIEERTSQAAKAIQNWSAQHQSQVESERAAWYAESQTLAELSFTFASESRGGFAMESIATVSPDTPDVGGDVIVAKAAKLGQELKLLRLRDLFARRPNGTGPEQTIHQLAKRESFPAGITLKVTPSGLESPGDQIAVSNLIQPGFDFIRKQFSSVFLLDSYRHGAEKTTPQYCERLMENGSNLASFVLNLNLNNYAAFSEIAAFVKRIVPEVGRLHARFTGMQDHSVELAYDWEDGRKVNLANMGGGVEQLLVLACLLIAQRTSCILWEEPESHLHPGAQDVLLDEIENRVGDSLVFLTTHSPAFIRASSQVAVHAITNPDGKSGKGRTLSQDQLHEVGVILGSRPGHLALADIVIYVEGKSGANTLEEWMQKWPDRETVLGHLLMTIWPCNPDEIASEGSDLNALKKLTPNMLFFADKDNDPGCPDPKEARKRLVAICDEHDIPCVITDRRQIEDYFTEEAVRIGLPGNLSKTWVYDDNKPMGEQLCAKWKRHNRRIAAAMTWQQIKKHEALMQVFRIVTDYAAKLKL